MVILAPAFTLMGSTFIGVTTKAGSNTYMGVSSNGMAKQSKTKPNKTKRRGGFPFLSLSEVGHLKVQGPEFLNPTRNPSFHREYKACELACSYYSRLVGNATE